MTGTLEQVSGLLHEAGETHHQIFRIVDGADDDWASWYAQWLIELSELPDLLGVRPVRSELIYLLVSLDKQFTAEAPGEPWETYYARQILRHFPAIKRLTTGPGPTSRSGPTNIRTCRVPGSPVRRPYHHLMPGDVNEQRLPIC